MTESAYWAARCRYCEAPLRRDGGCSRWYGEPHDLPYRERTETMTETAGTGAATAGHGYACCCEVCDVTDPHWTIMRRGDVVTSWACDDHLAVVCGRLQRDFEVTELIVRDSRKARERAAAARAGNAATLEDAERRNAEYERYAYPPGPGVRL